MNILKRLKKQQRPADLAAISKAVVNVKKLIDMKALSVNMEKPEISLFPELWIGKDDNYKSSFCKNVLMWRSLTLKEEMPQDAKVLNIETGETIGEYRKNVGFIGI